MYRIGSRFYCWTGLINFFKPLVFWAAPFIYILKKCLDSNLSQLGLEPIMVTTVLCLTPTQDRVQVYSTWNCLTPYFRLLEKISKSWWGQFEGIFVLSSRILLRRTKKSRATFFISIRPSVVAVAGPAMVSLKLGLRATSSCLVMKKILKLLINWKWNYSLALAERGSRVV